MIRLKLHRDLAACAAVLWAAICWIAPAQAAPKHHSSHLHRAAAARAAHLVRLAAQEKAAWRAHLVKVHSLPRRARLAVTRHDKRLARQKAAQIAQAPRVSHGRAARLARAAHLARLAALVPAHTHRASQAQRDHARRLAQSQGAHNAHLAAHNARLARAEAAHAARVAAVQAAHLARARAYQQALAQRALAHQSLLTKRQTLHSARLVAQRAHWVALHGDGSGGHSIKFWQTVAAGVPVKCITVDLNDDNVKVSAVMARRGTGTAEPFRQMIDRANPNVAVTGTFFSLDNRLPVGDIVIDGSLIHFGGMGTALCITPANHAEMVTCAWGRHHDWSPYDFVVACGPRLLEGGRVVLDPRAERFKDRHMLAPNSRIAVGITRGNKVVFVMTHKPIYLGRLAKVMRSIGASEAMNLDAGTSTGFYYNGATLAHPGRQLTNMIVVYGRKDRYERALPELLPAAYHRMGTHYRRVSQGADSSVAGG